MSINKLCEKAIFFIVVFTFYQNTWSQLIEKQTLFYKDSLQLDYYSLKKEVDKSRVLLILVHGGGFSGGSKDNQEEVKFASKMAKRGYAVASINYRLTRKGKSFGCDCNAKEKIETFVAVSEDISAAVLLLQSKNEKLKFDNDKTVLIGSSAGAEGVLNAVFMQNDYRFKHIPKFSVAGIISLAGAVLNKEYITKSNAVPTLFFHGEQDNLVPYGSAPHHYCNSTAKGYLQLDGSNAITKKLKKIGTSFILAFDPEGKHEWAGLGYTKVPLIENFIEETIVKKKFFQAKVKLQKK